MNAVSGVTRSQVAGKDDADDTFFNRDLFTDFELGFVRTACQRSMWGWLLHQFHCDAQGEKDAFLPSVGIKRWKQRRTNGGSGPSQEQAHIW